MIKTVQRDQHLCGSDATIGTHGMVRDTLPRLDNQHIALVVELDGSRKSQSSSNLGCFPPAREDTLIRRVTCTRAGGRNGCARIAGARRLDTRHDSVSRGDGGSASCRCCQ